MPGKPLKNRAPRLRNSRTGKERDPDLGDLTSRELALLEAQNPEQALAVASGKPVARDDATGCTPDEERFCGQLALGFKPADAAKWVWPGWPRAWEYGAALSKKPHIVFRTGRLRILLQEKREQNLVLTQERVMQEIARGAFRNVRTMLNEDWSPKRLSELDDSVVSCIDTVEYTDLGTVKKVKLAPKEPYLRMAAEFTKVIKAPDKENGVKVEFHIDMNPKPLPGQVSPQKVVYDAPFGVAGFDTSTHNDPELGKKEPVLIESG